MVALDERGTSLTTKALAERLRAGNWAGTMGVNHRRPDGLDPLSPGNARAHPPVRPDPAARHGARAADRAALPRLVGQRRAPVPPGIACLSRFCYKNSSYRRLLHQRKSLIFVKSRHVRH